MRLPTLRLQPDLLAAYAVGGVLGVALLLVVRRRRTRRRAGAVT